MAPGAEESAKIKAMQPNGESIWINPFQVRTFTISSPETLVVVFTDGTLLTVEEQGDDFAEALTAVLTAKS